jgi:hypothetical protein
VDDIAHRRSLYQQYAGQVQRFRGSTGCAIIPRMAAFRQT